MVSYVAEVTCNIDSFLLQSVLRKFKPLLDRVLVERITAANVSYTINVLIFGCAMFNNPSLLVQECVCMRLNILYEIDCINFTILYIVGSNRNQFDRQDFKSNLYFGDLSLYFIMV